MGGCGSKVRVTREGCEFGNIVETALTTEYYSGSQHKSPTISRIAWDERGEFGAGKTTEDKATFVVDRDSAREEQGSAWAEGQRSPSSSSRSSCTRVQAQGDRDSQFCNGSAIESAISGVERVPTGAAVNYVGTQRVGPPPGSPPATIDTPKQQAKLQSSTNNTFCTDTFMSAVPSTTPVGARKPACGDGNNRQQERPATTTPQQRQQDATVPINASVKGAGNGVPEPAAPTTPASDTATQWVIRPGPPVESVYKLGEVLGQGSFGMVRSATHLLSGAEVAVKTIKKALLGAADVSSLRREVEILHHLSGHPHISQLLGVFEEVGCLHLVLELYKGGDLFDAIISVGRHSERAAADVMRTVLTAISYCHAMGVAHRDIKPENFMLTAEQQHSGQSMPPQPGPRVAEGSRLKLIDFGLSAFCTDASPLTEIVGTSYYAAPEVLTGRYGRSADVWSAGVILHIMLTGYAPFDGRNDEEILRAVRKSKLDLSSDPVWRAISREAVAVLLCMLERDPCKRATADQLLSMPWLGRTPSACTAPSAPLPGVVSERLRRFARMHSFKKEARRVVAGLMRAEEVAGLVAQFRGLDADRDGKLSLAELKHGLARQELRGLAFGGAAAPLGDGELRQMIKKSDLNGDGALDQSEFLGAVLPTATINRKAQKALAAAAVAAAAAAAASRPGSAAAAAAIDPTENNNNPIAAAFRFFDTDSSGHISLDELRRALAAHHPSGRGPDLKSLFARVDRDADGRITYPEFVQMLLQDVDEEEEEEEEKAAVKPAAEVRQQQQPPPQQLQQPRLSGPGSTGAGNGTPGSVWVGVAIPNGQQQQQHPQQQQKTNPAPHDKNTNNDGNTTATTATNNHNGATATAAAANRGSTPNRGRSRGAAAAAWGAGYVDTSPPGAGLRLPPKSMLSRGGVATPGGGGGGAVSRASTGAFGTSPLDWWCDECGYGSEEEDGEYGTSSAEFAADVGAAAARRAAAAGCGPVRPSAPATGKRGAAAAAAAANVTMSGAAPSPKTPSPQHVPHPPPHPPSSPSPPQQGGRISVGGARPHAPQAPAGALPGIAGGNGSASPCPDPRHGRPDRGTAATSGGAGLVPVDRRSGGGGANSTSSGQGGSGDVEKPNSAASEEPCSFNSVMTNTAGPAGRFVCRPHPPSPPLHQLPAPPAADGRSRRHSVGGVPYVRAAAAAAAAAAAGGPCGSPEAGDAALLESLPTRCSLPSGRGSTQPGVYDMADGGCASVSGAVAGRLSGAGAAQQSHSTQPSPTGAHQHQQGQAQGQQLPRPSRRPPHLQPLRLPQQPGCDQGPITLVPAFNWSLSPSTPRTGRTAAAAATASCASAAAASATTPSGSRPPTLMAPAARSPSSAGIISAQRQSLPYDGTSSDGTSLLPSVGPSGGAPAAASRARRQSTGGSVAAWSMLPQQQQQGPQGSQVPLQPLTPRSVPLYGLSPRGPAAAVALHDGGSPVGVPHSHAAAQQGSQPGQQGLSPGGQRRSRGRRVTLMGMEELQVSPRQGAGAAEAEADAGRSSVPEGVARGGRFAGVKVTPASPPLGKTGCGSPSIAAMQPQPQPQQPHQVQQRYMVR